MKKIIATALFLSFVMFELAFGQVNLNFSSGVNLSNVEFKIIEDIDTKSRLGYFFAIAPGYQMNEKVRLLLNAQYSLKGFKIAESNNLTASEYRYSYFDIIPEVEYYILDYLALGVGLNYGIKLNEQFKFNNEEWSDAGNIETIKSSDFGLTGKLKFTHKNIFSFIRYNIGLKDISELNYTDINGEDIDNAKLVNRNLQIGIGYSWN